jgi:hypothetical protein
MLTKVEEQHNQTKEVKHKVDEAYLSLNSNLNAVPVGSPLASVGCTTLNGIVIIAPVSALGSRFTAVEYISHSMFISPAVDTVPSPCCSFSVAVLPLIKSCNTLPPLPKSKFASYINEISDFGSGGNVLQDFISGNTATLKLQQGDGTVSTAGEMNIECEIYSTAVNLDPNADTGAVITIPFKVVQPTSSGAASGTAFKFEYADSTPSTGW